MEKEAARSNESVLTSEKDDRQSRLLERWRKEVFDGLLRNKRYELLIKDNLQKYNKDLDTLKLELKQSKTDAELAKNKVALLENETKIREETLSKG